MFVRKIVMSFWSDQRTGFLRDEDSQAKLTCKRKPGDELVTAGLLLG